MSPFGCWTFKLQEGSLIWGASVVCTAGLAVRHLKSSSNERPGSVAAIPRWSKEWWPQNVTNVDVAKLVISGTQQYDAGAAKAKPAITKTQICRFGDVRSLGACNCKFGRKPENGNKPNIFFLQISIRRAFQINLAVSLFIFLKFTTGFC